MKAIGEKIFRLRQHQAPAPEPAYSRLVAKDIGLQEKWFRDAIFQEPELVIAACRVAGRVDPEEVWLPWRIEANFGSGPIDVLLVSSHGRIGIVETKLSYNPQKRREVVAQVLDYALSLQETDREDLPDLPDSPFAPTEEDLQECLATGRFLLLIAGDALDPRAVRLSQSVLARHLTSEWDLAMIDLNLYQSVTSPEDILLVPELLGIVQSDLRQVVRVLVEGESPKARIVVDKIVNEVKTDGRGSRLASNEAFLAAVKEKSPEQLEPARILVQKLEAIAASSRGNLVFALQRSSANLYLTSDSGLRRFIAIRADGRFRIILRYLRSKGHDDVIERIIRAANPTFRIGHQDKAVGTQISAANTEELAQLLDRIESSLLVP